MATHHMFLFATGQDTRRTKPAEPLRQPGKVQNDVLLNALIEMPAALRAVLKWKCEPTSLNSQPISVELQGQVHFNLNSRNR